MKTRPLLSKWIRLGLGSFFSVTIILTLIGAFKPLNETPCDQFTSAIAQNNGGGVLSSVDEDTNNAPDTEANRQMFSDIAKLLDRHMPEVHLLHKPFDAAMSANAWTNYLNSLDYQRKFFIQSDIDEFETSKFILPDYLREGDLTFAGTVFDRLRQRVRERMDFVEQNVSNALDFADGSMYQWKRDELPWPEDQEQQDALWRASLANSAIASIVSTTINNEKNREKQAEYRLTLTRHILETAKASPDISENELDEGLARFDTALSDLALPTNELQRAEFCKTLMPEWERPISNTNSIDEATNTVAEIEPFHAVAPEESEIRTDENDSTPCARLESLLIKYVTATTGIKTDEEAHCESIEQTIRSYRQYLDILNHSDEEFYLSKFCNAVTGAYDPHSSYLTPVAQEDFGIDMQLSLQGIGAQLQSEDGTAKIVEIIPGSPAERDKSETRLVPGDKIIGVAQSSEDFVDIRHWPLYKAVRLIRGPKGSTVRLQVIPASDITATKIVTLIRDEIKLEEQAASSALETISDETESERKLGYIKLPTFYASMKLGKGPDASPRSATLDVARLIAELNEEHIEGLVLDLRGNGGGSLPEAVYLTGLFIRTGPVVQVKETRRTITLPDNDPAIAFKKPMIVLINRLSASASEIVAGALQDYGRAIIVGDTHSHGKGTVQTLIPVQNGTLGSLKATTASFYRITGSSTQIRGVSSDIHLPSVFEHYTQLGEDKLPNAIPWSRTGPARYRRIDSFDETIPLLSERSEKRRAKNEKWQKHIQLLDRFAAITTNTVVSLDFETRLERAKADEALQREISSDTTLADAQNVAEGELTPLPPDDPPKDETKEEREARRRKNDDVLKEALHILVDLIDLHGSPRNLTQEPTPYDFLNTFFR